MVEYSLPTVRFGAATRDTPIVAGRISPLELLHPDGMSMQSLIMGSNCPEMLRCNSSRTSEGVDVTLLAPTAAECRTSGWLEAATQSLAQQLASDGVGYVLAPPRWRLRIIRLLRGHGLVIGPLIEHLPDWASSRYLVPLSSIAASYAFANLIPSRLLKRYLASMPFRQSLSEKLVARLLHSIGFVVRRPGSRPLFHWLLRLGSAGSSFESVMMSTGCRGQDGSIILHGFQPGEARPSVVAKINLAVSGERIHEAAILARLGPDARSAGAQVPKVLITGRINQRSVLLETGIAGRLMVVRLCAKPKCLPAFLERLTFWLERWNLATRTFRGLDREQLDRELLMQAQILAPVLKQGEEYRDWLMTRCAKLTGTRVPVVATHNDLTMSNIFLDGHKCLGVIDWETAREGGLPLVDFFYASTDAVAATDGYANRLQAFEACFAPNGKYASVVRRLEMRLRRALEIPDDLVELCFHACWLHHAVNEHRTEDPSNKQPFLRIIQRLVQHRFCKN